MKQEIEKFKKENGTVTYTTKELIGALHVKTDNILDKLDKKADKVMVWKLMGGMILLITIIVGLLK